MSKISIGMPVYNGERFVAKALDSLLEQTYTDFEIVILDNASTDRTPAIAEQYARREPRVTYHRNLTNIGAPGNFNKVFDLCQAEYFKWAAADDLLAPRYLERCVEVLDYHPDVVLCHTDVKVVDDDGREIADYKSPLAKLDAERAAERFADLVLQRHACFDVFGVMRREALARTPRIGSYKSTDRNLLAELALMGRIFIVREPMFYSRDHLDRSVRIAAPKQVREWWGQRGSLVFPYWRHMVEYVHSARRADVSWRERMSCYGVVFKWMRAHWRHLGSDVRTAARETLRL